MSEEIEKKEPAPKPAEKLEPTAVDRRLEKLTKEVDKDKAKRFIAGFRSTI